MNFETKTTFLADDNRSQHQVYTIGEHTSNCVTSLLGFYRLNFDFQRDITDSVLLDYFGVGNIFLKNFKENGYSSLYKYQSGSEVQVEMGTGYALVTEEYLNKRGKQQGILSTTQGDIVGITSFTDDKGVKHQTNIYFVGAAQDVSGKPIGATYKKEDIYEALQGI